MKLDDTFESKKAGLDITPLIDVVFLLVLFFAVTTSFISPEDLESLQHSVSFLTVKKDELSQTVSELEDRVATLRNEVAVRDKTITGLRTDLDGTRTTLATTEVSLAQVRGRLEVSLADLEKATREAGTLTLKLDRATGALDTATGALDAANRERARLAGDLRAVQARAQSAERDLAVLTDVKDGLGADRDRLAAELAETRGALARLERDAVAAMARRDSLAAEATRLGRELESTRTASREHKAFFDAHQAAIARASEAQASLGANLGALTQDSTLNIERDQNRLVINLSDKILFDSGSADLKASGLDVLSRVGRALVDAVPDMDVQIGGHTDNVPIRGRFASNWELSAARAVNVVRHLEEQVAIDARRLVALGYGEFRPIASNDTPEGRALNRRIELVLVPR